MVRSHEIRDRIHVSKQSMDFGGLARCRQAIEINGSLRRRRTWTEMSPSMKLDLWRRVFFSQVQGVDYDEIFSSVAKLKSVGIMLALAAFMKSGIWMSKTSFLTSFRKERLYVIQSERFCRS